jgi:hypothetical protein
MERATATRIKLSSKGTRIIGSGGGQIERRRTTPLPNRYSQLQRRATADLKSDRELGVGNDPAQRAEASEGEVGAASAVDALSAPKVTEAKPIFRKAREAAN